MNTFLKGRVPVESNETRWMVGCRTGRETAARVENGTQKTMDVVHDAAETAFPVSRKGYRRSAGRDRGMVTRQLPRRGLLSAGRGLEVGLPGLLTGGDGGPVWPIRLVSGRCGGEYTKMGPGGETDNLGHSDTQRG